MQSSAAPAEAFERTWIAHRRRFLAGHEDIAARVRLPPIRKQSCCDSGFRDVADPRYFRLRISYAGLRFLSTHLRFSAIARPDYDPAGPAVPSFGPRYQLMMSVNSDAAPFEPVRLSIAVIDEKDCVRVCWEIR